MRHLELFIAVILSARVKLTLTKDFFPNVVLPSEISVVTDESLYIKIVKPIENQTECSYQAPGKKEFNTEDFFVKFSDEKCGIKIEKVQKSHAGTWKLISKNDKNSVRGASVVRVKDKAVVPHNGKSVYSSMDEFVSDNFKLNYCYVSRNINFPSISEINSGKCILPANLTQDYKEGEWNIYLGAQGQSSEIVYTVNVQSNDEFIEASVIRLNDSIAQLSCRVRNLRNVIKFCRFERTSDSFGLNLEVGLAFGYYQYYGDGFANGDCGMKINNLDAADKGQWKCFVGLIDYDDAMNEKITDDNKKLYKLSSVLDASGSWNQLKIINDESILYLVDNKSALIFCHSNLPIEYCWFQHPAGKMLSVSEKRTTIENQDFQYYGDGFNMGQCGIKIRKFYFSDGGNWRCGVGRVSEAMREAVKEINIEVKASFMMAITKQIEDFSRNSIVLQCRATTHYSLASCHFLTPTGQAFSINEDITQYNAIDGMFYFDPNRKLSDGYCTVVIKDLDKNQHAGRWTCSGRILGHDEESYDTIYVTVDGIREAGFSFLTVAIVLPLFVATILILFAWHKYQIYRKTQGEVQEVISMHTLNSNNTEVSSNSAQSERSSIQL